MRAHYLQHVPFEGLGSIESWLITAGYDVTRTALFETVAFPAVEDVDLLIVMGGPMSVNDEEIYPWLVAEKAFIRCAIELGRPVLGICLGAQLIASAFGARVYPNSEKEIGWFPVQGISHDVPELFRFPSSVDVFHWHGETFDLPSGATLLARSEACNNQAFQIGDSVIGLQFHLETIPKSARDIVENCRNELISSQYVQTAEEILSVDSERYRETNRLMSDILTFIR